MALETAHKNDQRGGDENQKTNNAVAVTLHSDTCRSDMRVLPQNVQSSGSVTIKNLKSHRRCNNMSRMNLSGYVGHVTIFG